MGCKNPKTPTAAFPQWPPRVGSHHHGNPSPPCHDQPGQPAPGALTRAVRSLPLPVWPAPPLSPVVSWCLPTAAPCTTRRSVPRAAGHGIRVCRLQRPGPWAGGGETEESQLYVWGHLEARLRGRGECRLIQVRQAVGAATSEDTRRVTWCGGHEPGGKCGSAPGGAPVHNTC